MLIFFLIDSNFFYDKVLRINYNMNNIHIMNILKKTILLKYRHSKKNILIKPKVFDGIFEHKICQMIFGR